MHERQQHHGQGSNHNAKLFTVQIMLPTTHGRPASLRLTCSDRQSPLNCDGTGRASEVLRWFSPRIVMHEQHTDAIMALFHLD